MQNYLRQLLNDISNAEQNNSNPFADTKIDIHDWISDEEEDKTAPVHNLQEWTGIFGEMLPPERLLSNDQAVELLDSLKKLLSAHNWHFVLQTAVSERIQYETIRQNFDQQIKRWHMGFFQLCKPGTEHKSCTLGEYCQCAFYEAFFSQFEDEELSPEEERARLLQIEITHIQRRHGDEWMKYYPYHLDPEHDDENGNPYNYGFDDTDDDEEEDGWWRQ
jgi:hypothetical protein